MSLMSSLLAVDLGLKTGLALYSQAGRLCWYRSKNFGTTARLKRGVRSILNDLPDLTDLIIEGGGPLAEIWLREAERRHIIVRQVSAETWREQLLHPRERRSAQQAKQKAGKLARQIIAWSGAARPTSLRHDAAEAILIGFWGVLEIGWLEYIPEVLGRS